MAELIALGMVKTVSIGQSAAKQLRVDHGLWPQPSHPPAVQFRD